MPTARVLRAVLDASCRQMPTARVLRAISALQAAVQRDEGRRGIAALCRPNQLLEAAQALLRIPRGGAALVLTGFPCHGDRTPPVETDGPPGAAAVARSLLALGIAVSMPIERHSQNMLERCTAAACAGEPRPAVVGFPTSDSWGAADDVRLYGLRSSASAVVAIERAGASSDGTCYTMRAFPMGSNLIAHQLNSIVTAGSGRTVGVGDGGNELGMGSLYADVCREVPNGATIGCVVPSDFPLVASVSNWGAYALCCACALLAWDEARVLASDGTPGAAAVRRTPEEYVERLVPSLRGAEAAVLAANKAGAVDGITAEAGGSVDGMPLETHLALLAELRAITLVVMGHGGKHGQRGAP